MAPARWVPTALVVMSTIATGPKKAREVFRPVYGEPEADEYRGKAHQQYT